MRGNFALSGLRSWGYGPRVWPGSPGHTLGYHLFTASRRLHETFLLDLGWLVAASTIALLVLIAIGVVMLMQPFAIAIYTWSFVVTLIGTVMFIIVSHFPE